MSASKTFFPKPLALAVIGIGFSHPAAAAPALGNPDLVCPEQACLPGDDPRTLAPTPQTSEEGALPPDYTRLTADEAHGQSDVRASAGGNVILERNDQLVNADWLDYNQTTGIAQAGDRFILKQGDSLISGRKLRYDLNQNTGIATETTFETITVNEHGRHRMQGVSDSVEMLGNNLYRLNRAKFNTCRAGDDSWYIAARRIDADNKRNIGVARDAALVFKGVPLLYSPWLDFPLNGQRKSGFLMPNFSYNTNSLEIEIPYYFNLAPNYDATLAPHWITGRGLMLGGQFRYLFPTYKGQLDAQWLPKDRKNPLHNRYEVRWSHLQDFNPHLSGGVEFNQVSDADWFADFGDRIALATSVQLDRSAWLTYRDELWDAPFTSTLKVQKYQTMQQTAYQVERPYQLMPQLQANWYKHFGSALVNVDAEAAHFRGQQESQQNGNRLVLYPSVRWDLHTGWGFVRPKLGLHLTHYQLDPFQGASARNVSRVLPIFNVDAGMTFERELAVHRHPFIQTLEPRLFYNYIPARDQNDLPNFDSSLNSLNFYQLFSENRFSGQDRINAANTLTVAATSRILDARDGSERLRFGIGQQYNLSPAAVTLTPSLTENPKRSDLLAFFYGNINPKIGVAAEWHYNSDGRYTPSLAIGANYHPAPGKVINLRYKYDTTAEIYPGSFGTLNQIDAGIQWPLSPTLSLVGQHSYSFAAQKPINSLVGLQYQSRCRCWGVSLVAQRYLSAVDTYRTGVKLQLELRDLTSVGNGLSDTLKQAIPGYYNINEVK